MAVSVSACSSPYVTVGPEAVRETVAAVASLTVNGVPPASPAAVQ